MNYLNKNFEKTELGYIFENNHIFVFFGNKKASLETISTHFSNYQFFKIKQTHSDFIIEQNGDLVEADAHFTSNENKALLVATADCLPVMIACRQTNRVAAVHAGWKGVVNQIVPKTIQRLIDTGSTNKDFDFLIGPHIGENSFEVDAEVYELLVSAVHDLEKVNFSFVNEKKYFVNLLKIVNSQIKNVLDKQSKINLLSIDTKISSEFWSFRRDKHNAGRNLSFILVKRLA